MVGNTHGNQNYNGTSHNPTNQNIIGIRANKKTQRAANTNITSKSHLYIPLLIKEQQIGHLVQILKYGENKPIGILEITTQTNFTVLLRTRKSGRCGRKENKQFHLSCRQISIQNTPQINQKQLTIRHPLNKTSLANYRINNSSSIKISPSRPSYHFPILIEKSTRHSNRQTGSGQHLVAKCVTNPELQGRPPNREVSIESRHKKCSPTFLFNRKRTRPGQHLVAKNVTNAEL